MSTLAVYVALLSVVGVWKLRRNLTFSSYFLSEERLGLLETSLTLMATWVDSAIILGFSGYCYLFGYDALWIAIPTSIGVYTFSLLFARKINKMEEAFTVSGIIKKAYGEQVAFVSSFFVFLYSLTLVSTNIMAGGYVLHEMFGLPYILGTLLMVIVVAFYTLIGGFKKVVETDIVQFFFVIGGLLVLIFFIVKSSGGLDVILAGNYKPSLAFSKWDIFSFFVIFIFPFWANPSFYQRCKAAKSPEIAALGVAMVGFIDFTMTFVALIVGLAAIKLFGTGMPPDSVFPHMVKALLPSGARDIVALAVLSAVMSTADSYLLISGGIISHDMIGNSKKLSSKMEVVYAKIGVVISAVISFVCAFWFNNIMEAAMFAFSLFVSSNLVALVSAFYFKESPFIRLPALLSMISGGITVVLWTLLKLGDVSVSVMYGLPISGIVWLSAYFIIRRRGNAYA